MTSSREAIFGAAAVQAAPVFLDREATVEKACDLIAEAGTSVVMGLNEKSAEASGDTLYNTILYIGPEGRILGRHGKLVPTVAERMVHAQGDGSGLGIHAPPVGRVGGLICWENDMPLGRYALYAAGIDLYAAPTWDRGEPWNATLRHIAKEGASS